MKGSTSPPQLEVVVSQTCSDDGEVLHQRTELVDTEQSKIQDFIEESQSDSDWCIPALKRIGDTE